MSMDLREDCPHCEAKAGEICTLQCTANGDKVKVLHSALYGLGLTIENLKLSFDYDKHHYYRPGPENYYPR